MSSTLKQTIANIITTSLIPLSQKYEKKVDELIDKDVFLYIARLFDEGKINNHGLSKILEYVIEKNTSINDIENTVKDLNIIQIDDESTLSTLAQKVIDANDKQVQQFKSGNEKVIDFLIGMCMKESKGQANPEKIKATLFKLLA